MFCLFEWYVVRPDPTVLTRSSPTRRSSERSADSNSESRLPSLDRAASLTWRGKPMQPRTLSRAWRTAPWLRRLSGLTLEHSTLDDGAALFRSEEHTSALQSLMRSSYAVFCLKKPHTRHNHTTTKYDT